MTLYLDSSALVKRYVAEEGSGEVIAAMARTARWVCCRPGFVETVRAVGIKAGSEGTSRVKADWSALEIVEVDAGLAERAADLALSHRLRSLDALHLAAALTVPDRGIVFATWDARLHAAARAHGLRTLPAALG